MWNHKIFLAKLLYFLIFLKIFFIVTVFYFFYICQQACYGHDSKFLNLVYIAFRLNNTLQKEGLRHLGQNEVERKLDDQNFKSIKI